MKKLDVASHPKLSVLIEELNKLGVQKEDIVSIFPPQKEGYDYIVIFYYSK